MRKLLLEMEELQKVRIEKIRENCPDWELVDINKRISILSMKLTHYSYLKNVLLIGLSALTIIKYIK